MFFLKYSTFKLFMYKMSGTAEKLRPSRSKPNLNLFKNHNIQDLCQYLMYPLTDILPHKYNSLHMQYK